MGTSTIRHSLYKPTVGETGWGTLVNANMTEIDTWPLFKKGSDVASQTALFTAGSYPTNGNYFDITGTANITSILTSGNIGTPILLHFDAALTITHDGTNIVLPGNNDIITEPGDELIFYEYATGDWRCVGGTAHSSNIRLLGTTSAVNLNSAAQTTIYTVPTGRECILTHVVVRLATGDASVTPGQITIGEQGSATDFLAAQVLTNLDATTKAIILQPVPNATPVPVVQYAAAAIIEVDVTVTAGGVATADFDVFGYLF